MTLLLDTCCLLWIVTKPDELSAAARIALEDFSNLLTVSAISAFEIGLLHRSNQLRLPDDPEIWFANALAKFDIRVISVSWEIAMRSVLLPEKHRDPADRIIVASALETAAAIVTPDGKISQYPGIKTIW